MLVDLLEGEHESETVVVGVVLEVSAVGECFECTVLTEVMRREYGRPMVVLETMYLRPSCSPVATLRP